MKSVKATLPLLRTRPLLYPVLLSMSLVCGCSLLPAPVIDTSPRGKHTNSEDGGLQVRLSERGNMESYVVGGERYHTLQNSEGYSARGIASWYGPNFHGRTTSNGEVYDMYRLTAAHRSLPLPSYVRVTHVENGKSVVLKVNDRGPFAGDRLIDLSFAAALKLDMVHEGTAMVEVQAIPVGELMAMTGPDNTMGIDFFDPEQERRLREDGALVTVDAAFQKPAADDDLLQQPPSQSQAQQQLEPTVAETIAPATQTDELQPAETPKLVAGANLDIDALIDVEGELAKQAVETVYYVQAGVFPTADAAERAAVDVVLELPNESVVIKPLKGSDMHRVTVGPVASSDHAQTISSTLTVAGIDNFAVKVAE